MGKQKTPKQIKKEMEAEIRKIHGAVSRLNQLKRSFKRLDEQDRGGVIDKLDVEESRFCAAWVYYFETDYDIRNPPRPKRRRHRRRHTNPDQPGSVDTFRLPPVPPSLFGFHSPFWFRLPLSENKDEFPDEIDA